MGKIGRVLGIFVLLTAVFWIIEILGWFDYLLWDAPYDSQAHQGNWVNGLLAICLYLWLPIVLTVILAMWFKPGSKKQSNGRQPDQTSSTTVSTIATAMADHRGELNAITANNWLTMLFSSWVHGLWEHAGSSADGSEDYLLRVSCIERPIVGVVSVQVNFMIKQSSTHNLVMHACFIREVGQPDERTIDNPCEFTDERLSFMKDALEQLSGWHLP